MAVKDLLEELYGRQSSHFKLSLGPVRRFARKLGNPERKLRVIHVAGTNGKGSTCMMLDSILRKAGYRTGLYTSPHLKRFNERIKVDGIDIPDNDIAKLYRRMRPHITTESFFEITTLLGFLYFAEQECDVVVVEVGLGGRLDATNIVEPLVSVITSIGKEHTHYLGNTIKEIATEKGGIIKPGAPVVNGAAGKATRVIGGIARERGCLVHHPKRIVSHNGSFSVGRLKGITFRYLAGRFQRRNAAIAMSAIDALDRDRGIRVSDEALRKGLEQTRCPARFEFVRDDLVVDSAHNVPGLLALEKELSRYRGKKVFLIAIMRDKSVRPMMKVINRMADEIVVTSVNPERACLPDDLARMALRPVVIEREPRKAMRLARKKTGKRGLVVVAGSMYLAGMFSR